MNVTITSRQKEFLDAWLKHKDKKKLAIKATADELEVTITSVRAMLDRLRDRQVLLPSNELNLNITIQVLPLNKAKRVHRPKVTLDDLKQEIPKNKNTKEKIFWHNQVYTVEIPLENPPLEYINGRLSKITLPRYKQ